MTDTHQKIKKQLLVNLKKKEKNNNSNDKEIEALIDFEKFMDKQIKWNQTLQVTEKLVNKKEKDDISLKSYPYCQIVLTLPKYL